MKRHESELSRDAALAQLAVRFDLDAAQAAALTRLMAALAAEPEPHTRIVHGVEAVEGHIADALVSLDAGNLRDAARVADIGSGAGFPGLALAVAMPNAQLDLIEATRRKVVSIERLARTAGISNARGVAARAEEWGAGEGARAYEAVTARALAPLAVLVEYAAPLLAPGGVLIAWKGARVPDEESAGAAAADMVGLLPTVVMPVTPFVSARNRHLHVYRKVAPTPERFPRRPGMAVKNPLA